MLSTLKLDVLASFCRALEVGAYPLGKAEIEKECGSE